jgi:uncharacterized protein YjbI with pentapeptide repeats
MTAEQMAANPSGLSCKTITCDIESDLVMENAVIKNANFVNSRIYRSKIKNVTFENCNFKQAHFWRTTFENVTFKGGSVTFRLDPKTGDEDAFELVVFKNVVIDGVKLNGYFSTSSAGGSLTLKNLKNLKNKNVLFFVNDVNLIIDNIEHSGDWFVSVMGKESTVYVRNSIFKGRSSGIGGHPKSLYIENSKLLGGYIGGAQTAVIKNSYLKGQIGDNGHNLFLINNQLPCSKPDEDGEMWCSVALANEDNLVFVENGNSEDICLRIAAAKIYVRNSNFNYLKILSFPSFFVPHTIELENLNIKNLYLSNLNLKEGRWQNETVSPPSRISNSKIDNLRLHNVVFSTQTADAKINIKINESSKPLVFTEIKVPTPEDLGIILPK